MRAVVPTVIPGTIPLILVAPHGGHRDYANRPWGSGRLRVNDLHTASLTRELAAATGAAALINDTLDRNDVDLNRLSAACDRAPAFLERLADCIAAALAAHGRATVLTVHGWNVIQPVVDLGIGCKPGETPDGRTAVSAVFAARAVPALVRSCAARDITATVGARYPASGRENLVQLFTPRYRDDGRPLVRQLAALGQRAQAMQCELGIPLRWPGAWRRRLVDAVRAALSPLLEPDVETEIAAPAVQALPPPRPDRPHRRTLEAVGADGGLLVTTDSGGGRLLLFPPCGGLALFTGERTGGEAPGRVGGLSVDDGPDGALQVRFAGPMMRFPDTTPFLDLERGLGTAHAVEDATVDLAFSPFHACGTDGAFGRVTGSAMLDGQRLDLGGEGFAAASGGAPGPWPRVRAALALPGGRRLSLVVGLADTTVTGFICDGSRHRQVTQATAVLGPRADPLDGFGLSVELAGGERVDLSPEPVHRLPVIRGGGPVALRLVYASCRVPAVAGLAGWCEIGGV